jgi:hypothetical protein
MPEGDVRVAYDLVVVNRSRLVIPLVVPWLWVAVPAQAGDQTCPDGAACIWGQTDFRGSRVQVPSDGCIDSSIRSAVNRSDQVIHFFASGGCVGAEVATLAPGEVNPRMGASSATGDCSNDVVDPCSGETPTPPAP